MCPSFKDRLLSRRANRVTIRLTVASLQVIADPAVAAPLAQCCTVLARFVPPEFFMAALMPALTVDESNEACTNAVRSPLPPPSRVSGRVGSSNRRAEREIQAQRCISLVA